MTIRKAFTLVELVVVIMILGILAGVAAPRLLNTAGMATENGVRQTLAIVRDAIELYAADNAGSLPPGTDLATELEDYIRGDFPASPIHDDAATAQDVAALAEATASDETTGWRYDSTTGDFRVNNDATALSSDSSLKYDTL